ncbi:outer membrane lipoprotein-sorting protein, partial [Candidatus Bipolaricaulota bacterium]|nr:outer membrane lipoprotein-sorting protein [Candidatus Bipolaricaulota bacterium]
MRIRTTQIIVTALAVLALPMAVLAQPLATAQAILDQMEANTQSIEDLDATLTVETYSDGEISLTQQIRLSLLQPDRMRQEYLAPDYLAGNLTLVTDELMWIYIAAVDTWYEKDLSELSTAEQPWLVFRQFLRGVQTEFDDYIFELLGNESNEYHLQGMASTDDAVYGRIELWVNAETFVPNKRILYDVDGNLLVELRILEVELIDGVIQLARTMETYDESGELRSVIRYDSVIVNSGLVPSLFDRIEE